MDSNVIGQQIKSRRRAMKLTQEELAAKIGVNRVTLANYEVGKYLPSVPVLCELAKALQVPQSALTGDTNEPIKEMPKTPAIVSTFSNAISELTPKEQYEFLGALKMSYQTLFNRPFPA